jgi:hypothetical protein
MVKSSLKVGQKTQTSTRFPLSSIPGEVKAHQISMRLTLVKVLDALGIFTRTPSPALFLKLLMQATMRKSKSFSLKRESRLQASSSGNKLLNSTILPRIKMNPMIKRNLTTVQKTQTTASVVEIVLKEAVMSVHVELQEKT